MDFATFLRRTGANIRKARWLAKMTQEEMAAQGITYRYYQALEKGETNPTLRTLFTLARILRTSVAALVETEPSAKARRRTPLAEIEATPPPRGRKPRQRKRGKTPG